MKVLLATYWPLPYPGGIWTFISQLKKGLEDRGNTVDILSNNSDHSMFHILNRHLRLKKTEILPLILDQIRSDRNDLAIYNAEIDRYCMELSAAYFGLKQYDVIHTQDPIASWAISKVKPRQIPLVTSVHGSLSGEILHHIKGGNRDLTDVEIKQTPLWNYYSKLECLGYRSSDSLHTSSKWLSDQISSNINKRTVTFTYGLDHKTFEVESKTDTFFSRPRNKKVILFTGRLVHLKGIDYLLVALAKLKQVRNDWVCWIVGEGELKVKLRQQSHSLGLQSCVTFFDAQSNIPALLQQADMFILPSLQDNQPFSVIEAQLAGLPVIVTNAGGLPEMIIDQKTGLIVNKGNSDSLYHSILTLLKDEVLRSQLSMNAKQWALEQWSLKKMVERTIAMYKEALQTIQ
jgi:glycosyltransferase involved in cell wall biosynthesis